MEKAIFSPAAAAAFDLNTLPPGMYHVPGFGTVDLCSISVKEARRLFDYGFPYLTEKAAPVARPVSQAKKVQPAKDAAPGAPEKGADEEIAQGGDKASE